MPGRTLLFVGLLIVAIAGPYLLSEQGLLKPSTVPSTTEPFWSSWWGKWRESAAALPAVASAPGEPAVSLKPIDEPLRTIPVTAAVPGRPVERQSIAGPPGITLAEALRFDVTPEWVSRNWSRVTTQLPDTSYHAMRVPLMTGTDESDVAGSLTYFFNAQGSVDRITFYGTSGDYEPTATYLQQAFGLQRYASVGPALLLSFNGPMPLSVMSVENAVVHAADQPRSRYHLDIELNLPRPNATLSNGWLTRLQNWREGKMM